MTTTTFTAHGLTFSLRISQMYIGRLYWMHIENGMAAQSSIEYHNSLGEPSYCGVFDTPEEARADAEAYALQVMREMDEAHGRPCPIAAPMTEADVLGAMFDHIFAAFGQNGTRP